MRNFSLIFEKETKYNIFGIILISLLPLALLSRSAILNSIIIIINLLFLFIIFKEKKFNFLNNKYFYALNIFWASLILNACFSIDKINSLERALGFCRFIILIFAIKFFLNLKDSKYQKMIFIIWTTIFIITTFDLIFESIFGFNTLGYVSYMPGRLAGFLNKELKIGHFYAAFMLIALTTCHANLSKKNIFTYLIFFLFIIISFLIGERANFLRVLIIATIFLFLFEKKLLIKKLIVFIFFIMTFFLIINFNEKYKLRFWNQFIQPINETNYKTYVQNSQYGAHYETAKKIFKNNILFGVGLKNYRNESGKEIYEDNNFLQTKARWATHPHQLHWEFLSETGLFGYSVFIIFFIFIFITNIKSLIIRFNLYQLSSMLFIIASVLPLIPSGSFFTTYGATLFWINFSVMISAEENRNKNS
jgi:O-antigen ligase